MKDERQMIQDLQKRKQALIQRLKELNAKGPADDTETDVYDSEKNEIERELVEIMDRLTQLNYILKK
jgi:flagellar biosynthesis/type III secretory pathway chaperone